MKKEEEKEEKEGIMFNHSVFEETEDIFSSLANSQRLVIIYIISGNQKTLEFLQKYVQVKK